MPIAPRTTSPKLTYQRFLRDVTEGAMSIVQHLAQANLAGRPDPRLPDIVRSFCWLSSIVRRSVVIARYIDTIPPPAEQRHDKLMATLDWVLPFFAQHKIDLDTYTRMIDSELDGPDEEDDELENEWDDPDEFEHCAEQDNVIGRRPVVLVAELCRDFGMAMHGVPPEWLTAVPDAVRLYCARAAVAGIDHTPKSCGIGHLMER